jgi:class 3 adenylate cyclase
MLKTIPPGFWLAGASILLNVALVLWVYKLSRHRKVLRVARDRASLELQNLQQAFNQFAPRRIVDEVISKGVPASGESREVTVLFSDIVGFTAMSETLDAETLVGILNGYFRATSVAVTDHGGHLAKFLGDGFMAIFGAPEYNVWHTLDAALAIRQAVREYNEKLESRGLPPLDVRVGLHKGDVVAGIIGSENTLEYTVIGDVVNTAARIENLTRIHGVDILISSEVRSALDSRFTVKELPPEYVKGKSEPLVTYAIEGFRGDDEPVREEKRTVM